MKRPTTDGSNGSVVTTPNAGSMMQLLGSGVVAGGVALSRDEFTAIKKLYGFKPEKPNKKPPPPVPPVREDFDAPYKFEDAVRKHEAALKAHERWEDPRPLMQAGADRNAIRDAECDGLRLLAWLAKFVPTGEDPLKTLVRATADAGWDVNPEDIAWADDEEESA
jgi:hypothetical protein